MLSETHTFSQHWLFPLGTFAPIEFAIEAYKYYAGKDGYWLNSMFMIFDAGGGEMYLIDCDKNSSTYRQIYKHNYGAIDYDVMITMFDSVESEK